MEYLRDGGKNVTIFYYRLNVINNHLVRRLVWFKEGNCFFM